MMKMGKLGPQAEEIRKKYADNKQEMNRRMMELYKEQGASPILGCLPMLLQMPIWIALYSAIYAGIELRGAEFLPVLDHRPFRLRCDFSLYAGYDTADRRHRIL